MRFTESILEAFKRVDGIGAQLEAVARSMGREAEPPWFQHSESVSFLSPVSKLGDDLAHTSAGYETSDQARGEATKGGQLGILHDE